MGAPRWLASPDRLVALTCRRCGVLKQASDFGVSNGKVRSSCKECMNAAARSRMTDDDRERANERRRRKQRETATSAGQSGRRWTHEEVAVLLRDDLSEVEKAKRLGRSYAAIQLARKAARRGTLTIWEQPHDATGYRYHGCRCDECVRAYHEKMNPRVSAYRAAQQSPTLPTATRRGQQWTGPELEILATRVGEDLTLRDAAKMLGRTFAACRRMRHLVLHDPKYRALAGSSRPTAP